MKPWAIMLSRVVIIIGLYFAWFLTVRTLFFDYIYPLSPWFERNTVSFIILNDIIGLPLMVLVWRFLFKGNLFKAAQFRVLDRKSVGIALWIGLGAGLFTVAFSRLPAIASDKYQFRELFDYLNRAEWYVFFTFLILGNIYKETLFRGILMNEFRRVFPVWLAIGIQGVLYGALFFLGDIPLSLYGFLGAVIFALLYVWFKSIWAPIAAQIACQGSQYLLWHYGPESDNVAVLSVVMAIAAAMIAAGLFFAVKHRGRVAASMPDEAVTSA